MNDHVTFEGKRYLPQRRTELPIAVGRIILSASFLLAVYLDPSDPSRYANLTYAILFGYLGYSLLVGAATLLVTTLGVTTLVGRLKWEHLHIVTHVIDMMVFALLQFFTAGQNSPFFVYFIFLLICATIRWQYRGTLWTAAATLAVVIILAFYPLNILYDDNFELNRLIIRIVYLAVVATLLSYHGLHEQSLRNTFASLAQWPSPVSDEIQPLASRMLEHAAAILGVPRILLIWEEEDEPWLHVVLWSQEECIFRRERHPVFGSIVAEEIGDGSFFCLNAGAVKGRIILDGPDGLQTWRVAPLDSELQKRFQIKAVLASRLKGEKVAGHLLALDKKSMFADDLVLGEVVAHEIASRLDHFFLAKQLQHAAVLDERIRLARDLHDGLLQSLAGASLQLETAHRLVETEPRTARMRIQQIQQLLAAEQKDLRSHITELRPSRSAEDFLLGQRLEELAQRIMRQWNLSVEIALLPSAPLVRKSMAREVYFIVREALVNAVRHACASGLRAEVSFAPDRVNITVTDDGHGFTFRGRLDHDELSKSKRGPLTLRERVAALNGTLSIDSKETGACLEIILPIPYGERDGHSLSAG